MPGHGSRRCVTPRSRRPVKRMAVVAAPRATFRCGLGSRFYALSTALVRNTQTATFLAFLRQEFHRSAAAAQSGLETTAMLTHQSCVAYFRGHRPVWSQPPRGRPCTRGDRGKTTPEPVLSVTAGATHRRQVERGDCCVHGANASLPRAARSRQEGSVAVSQFHVSAPKPTSIVPARNSRICSIVSSLASFISIAIHQ